MSKKAALKVQEVEAEVVESVEATVNPVDELDAMFNELDSLGEIVLEAPAEVALDDEELDEESMIEIGQAANVMEMREKATEEMNEMSEAIPDDSSLLSDAIANKTTGRKAPVTKRISTMGLSKSAALTKALGAKFEDFLTLQVSDMSLDPEAQNDKRFAKMEEIDRLPVKIGEKVVNFYAHLANGAQLSNYTKIAIDLLIKNGEITAKSLRERYLSRPYTLGTSNSQTTQLMKVLTVLELAKKDGARLVPNPDSTLLPMFSAE